MDIIDKRISSSGLKEREKLSNKKELTVKVIEGKSLLVKSNVFCTITVLDADGKRVGKEHKTSMKKSNQNPIWNEIFKFAVPSNFAGIKVSVQSKLKLLNKSVGQVQIKFGEPFLRSEEVINTVFDITQPKGKNIKSSSQLSAGKLALHIQYDCKGDTVDGKVVSVSDQSSLEDSGKSLTNKWNSKNAKLKQTAYVVIKSANNPTANYPIAREGPRATEFVTFEKYEICISNEGILQLENLTDQLQMATGNAKIRGNKWYFEIKIDAIGEDAKVYIGWISDRFKKWGDKPGWFWSSAEKKKSGNHLEEQGEAWAVSNIIGCTLDLIKGRITYTKNGKIQTNFGDVKRGNQCGEHFIPAFALEKHAKITANFGEKPFQYPPEGYYPLHFNLGTEDRTVLEAVFANYTAKQELWDSDTKSGSSDYSTSSASSDSEDSESGDAPTPDPPETMMLPTLRGTLRYFSDLNIDVGADLIAVLVVSWKLNAKRAFYFTREEFVIGWSIAGCKTLDQMKDKITEWKVAIKVDQFIQFYFYCRKFFYDKKSHGVRDVDAVRIWELLLQDQNWAFFGKWIKFINSSSHVISAEVWENLPSFIEKYNKSMDGFDSDQWPKLFSEFKNIT